MDENRASALQYGHLGKAIYVPEKRSWAFSRSLEQPSVISYTGITKTRIPSPFSAPQLPASENKALLTVEHPELAACWPSALGEDLSRAVTVTSEICDPRVSTLFDIGNAVDHERGDAAGGNIPIAVVATGECRNSISFRLFEEDTVELTPLSSQTSHRIRVPSVGDAESTEWCPGGAPVRQISFARTVEESPTWVAARFPLSTVVFRPLYHKTRVPMRFDLHDSHITPPQIRNSRLDANPLVEISSSQTSGFPHADVTFNPWYQKQLGIVDERGNWSIWELSGRRRRNTGNWNKACIKSGSLPWAEHGGSPGLDDYPRHDGWAVIEWAGGATSFVVADRRSLMLYRMEGDHVWPYSVDLGLNRKSEWILDIKRSHCDASHVFVLTTSRILWLDVSPVIQAPDDQEKRSPLAPRLSWLHFRDPEDTTMRLNSLLIGEDMYVILYSRLNLCTLAFQCRMSPEGQIGMMNAPDPFILEVPPASDDLVVSQASGPGAQFSTLAFKEIASSSGPAGRKHGGLGYRLMKLFTLDSSLALRESVYVGPTGESDTEENLPGREALRVKKRHPTQKRQLAEPTDDFVVDDWDESVLGMSALMGSPPSLSAAASSIMPGAAMDFKPAYALTAGHSETAGDAGQAHERSFRECIEGLNGSVSSTGLSNQCTATILELLGQTPVLDDIDQNAQDLQELNLTLTPQDTMSENGYQLVILPRSLSSSSTADSASVSESFSKPNLAEVYDTLVTDWLSSLPHDLPGRTRISKERVIRGVAVDLVLSQVKVTPRLDMSKGTQPEEQTSDTGLPGVAGTSETTPSEGLEAGQPPGGQAYPNLSSLTTFNTQQQTPRSIATMLSHWQPGTDPASYDWQATVQEQESETETLRRTPTSRSRSRSRSRMKLSQSPGLRSSTQSATPSAVPAARHWGSQPDGANANAPLKLESSQAVEEDLPMTQVERGIFGGREAGSRSAAKARKKRTAGF